MNIGSYVSLLTSHFYISACERSHLLLYLGYLGKLRMNKQRFGIRYENVGFVDKIKLMDSQLASLSLQTGRVSYQIDCYVSLGALRS